MVNAALQLAPPPPPPPPPPPHPSSLGLNPNGPQPLAGYAGTNYFIVNIDGPINFNATYSLQDDGADLPFADINTLRFFFNLGIEVRPSLYLSIVIVNSVRRTSQNSARKHMKLSINQFRLFMNMQKS